MSEPKKQPEFRFYYSTNRYEETISFYKTSLQLKEMNSWNRGYCDKGTVFQSPNGSGLIEVEESTESPVLQGSLYIEVEDVDAWHALAVANNIEIVQPLTNMTYGHRSFKLKDPNNLVIGFFKYIEA
jgi:predicted enzyme related to lactoylglutathione lyase